MEYKNVDGVFSWNNDTFKANCKVEFDNDGLITLESISNEHVFCNEYDHRCYEFGNFSGTTDNEEQIDLKKVTMESYKQIYPNSFEFNVLYKSYEGSIYFDKNTKPDKIIFGLVNFITDIPESYTIELHGIKIRIYHLPDFINNKKEFLTRIRNNGEILFTSEVEIMGSKFMNYNIAEKNRFCDYLMYLLSLLSNNYSTWIYRKDFFEDEQVSFFQRKVYCLPYFPSPIGEIQDIHIEWQKQKGFIESLISNFILLPEKIRENIVLAIDHYLFSLSDSHLNKRLSLMFTCIEILVNIFAKCPSVDFSIIDKSKFGSFFNRLFHDCPEEMTQDEFNLIKHKFRNQNQITLREKIIKMRDYFRINQLTDKEIQKLVKYRNNLLHGISLDFNKDINEISHIYDKARNFICKVILEMIKLQKSEQPTSLPSVL